MENRIEVEKEIRESRNHEQFRYFVTSAVGAIVPFTVWGVNYGKIESDIWWGFFTVVTILVTVVSLLFGAIKMISTAKTVAHYRNVLTMYANIDERTHVPESAVVTTCLRPDAGRFGFQKINYFFWLDATEWVFFPVRPEFSTSKAYHLVQSVRLNGVMVRSYALIGDEFDDGQRGGHDHPEPLETLSFQSPSSHPVYRDTRATLIAYAVGEQTVYLAFDARLHERLMGLIPEKARAAIVASARVDGLRASDPIAEPPAVIPES